jgi:hypothetical protein
MVHHQIHRHERFNDFGIFAQTLHRRTHGGQIHQERHAGEILQDDSGDDERDFFGALGARAPLGQGLHVALVDLAAVTVAQHRFQDDAKGYREPRDAAEPGLFQSGQGIENALPTIPEVESLPRFKEVVGHKNRNSGCKRK